MKPQSFPKRNRIVKGDTFTLVLRRGGCAADDCLVVFAFQRTDSPADSDLPTRLGVTIPKKAGNAVIRNQWKRWIREAFRTQQSEFPAGYDFVVRPKKGAVGRWSKIRNGLPRVARRAAKAAQKRTTGR